MQRPLGILAGFFRIGLDELGDAVDQRMFKPLFDTPVAPFQVPLLGFLAGGALEAFGKLQHALGRIGTAVENHVLAGFLQFRLDLIVDHQLTGIDDAHVHARLDGVIEEHRMHGFAHRLVAAEGEGQVGDARRKYAHAAGCR